VRDDGDEQDDEPRDHRQRQADAHKEDGQEEHARAHRRACAGSGWATGDGAICGSGDFSTLEAASRRPRALLKRAAFNISGLLGGTTLLVRILDECSVAFGGELHSLSE
jgi:hypothetical protein